MAAGSGMMNLKTLTWDKKILAQIGLDQAQLPTIADQQSTVGKIIPEYRAKLGLNDETQIVFGRKRWVFVNDWCRRF